MVIASEWKIRLLFLPFLKLANYLLEIRRCLLIFLVNSRGALLLLPLGWVCFLLKSQWMDISSFLWRNVKPNNYTQTWPTLEEPKDKDTLAFFILFWSESRDFGRWGPELPISVFSRVWHSFYRSHTSEVSPWVCSLWTRGLDAVEIVHMSADLEMFGHFLRAAGMKESISLLLCLIVLLVYLILKK